MSPAHRLNNNKPRQDTIWIICIEALRHIIHSELYSSSSDSLHFNDKLYDFLVKTYGHLSLCGCRNFDARSILKIVLSSSQNS